MPKTQIAGAKLRESVERFNKFCSRMQRKPGVSGINPN